MDSPQTIISNYKKESAKILDPVLKKYPKMFIKLKPSDHDTYNDPKIVDVYNEWEKNQKILNNKFTKQINDKLNEIIYTMYLYSGIDELIFNTETCDLLSDRDIKALALVYGNNHMYEFHPCISDVVDAYKRMHNSEYITKIPFWKITSSICSFENYMKRLKSEQDKPIENKPSYDNKVLYTFMRDCNDVEVISEENNIYDNHGSRHTRTKCREHILVLKEFVDGDYESGSYDVTFEESENDVIVIFGKVK